MEDKLNAILHEAIDAVKAAKNIDDLENIRIKYLGRKGELTLILRSLGELAPEERGKIGKQSNVIKNQIETTLEKRIEDLNKTDDDTLFKDEWIDVTLNSAKSNRSITPGAMHPLSQVQYELEDIFISMGFKVLDGFEAETDYYNFEALNIPPYHPARDMQDTFWTEDGNLLRTHTSTIQIRGMENMEPPFRIVGPGRVFRYEATDASHEHTFYQVEGMMVDKDISVSNLIFTMKEVLKNIFKREVKVRLRPAYYPFVEPGFDLDFNCMICSGEGCKVCKQTGWIEFMGCGMVHPNVLKSGNIDSEKWSGFAFGMGLNRLIMMRYGINDIRHFQSGDIRFLKQF